MKIFFQKTFINGVRRIIFVHFTAMFLTTPTQEELKQFELSELIDMLARHTLEYIEVFKKQGTSPITISLRQTVVNIQMAIDSKRESEKLLMKN